MAATDTAPLTATHIRALLTEVDVARTPGRLVPRANRLLWTIAIGVLLWLLGACAFGTWMIWQGWTTGVWSSDSGTDLALAAPFALAIVVFGNGRFLHPLDSRVRQLIGGDGDLALPLAEWQPLPLPADDLPTIEEHVGPLRGLNDSARAGMQGCMTAFAYLVALALLALAFLPLGGLLGWFGPVADPVARGFITAGMALLIGGMVVVLWVARWGSRRTRSLAGGLDVIADADGLRWQDTRNLTGEHMLAWREVTSFLVVALGKTQDSAPTWVYLLGSRHKPLLWVVSRRTSREEGIASERLSRLIVTRTGLSLRNATDAFIRLAHARAVLFASDPRRQMETMRAQGRDIPPDLLPEEAIAMARRVKRRFWTGAGILCLCLLVLLVMQPAMQFYQSRTYGGLLSQAETTLPLFTDAMTPLNTIWTLPPSDPRGSTAKPTAHGYVVGGPAGQTIVTLAGPTFSTQALALTADVSQETPDNGASTQGGAGLLVRSSPDQSTQVVFFVYSNGDWALARLDTTAAQPEGVWSDLLSGTSESVHGDVGAVNTLGIVERGTSDYCYINGDLVGFDMNDTAPTSGQVGLFVNDGGYPATFTNFAVYPVE